MDSAPATPKLSDEELAGFLALTKDADSVEPQGDVAAVRPEPGGRGA